MLFLFSFSSRLDEYFFQKKKGLWVELVLSFSFPFSCLVKYVDPGSLFFSLFPSSFVFFNRGPFGCAGAIFVRSLFYSIVQIIVGCPLPTWPRGGQGEFAVHVFFSSLLYEVNFFFLYSVGLGIS